MSRKEFLVCCLRVTHLSSGRKTDSYTWGPFVQRPEAERCCSNLATQPDVLEASIEVREIEEEQDG